MYLLYVDESFHDRRLVLGGVLIVDSKLNTFNKKFEEMWVAAGFDASIELHTNELWNRREQFSSLNIDQARSVVESVTEVISPQRFVVAHTTSSNKEEKYVPLMEEMIGTAAKTVHDKGSRTSKQLMVIFDKSDTKHETHSKILSMRAEVASRVKRTCHIVDGGYEGDSKYSRLLQGADFVAYFYRRHLQLQREDTLFRTSDDKRFIAMVDGVINKLGKKLVLKELTTGKPSDS